MNGFRNFLPNSLSRELAQPAADFENEEVSGGARRTRGACRHSQMRCVRFLDHHPPAVNAGRFSDRAITALALVGISLPVAWLGLILRYVVAALTIIRAYVVGLYLTERAGTEQAVVAAPGPKRIEIRMLREANAKEFNRALVRGIHKNAAPEELNRLQERIRHMEDAINAIGTVREGDRITPFYDPMIAKILTHGSDRADAIMRMAQALEDTRIEGLETNLAFLRNVVRHPAFGAGLVRTNFIERHRAELLAPA